MYTFREPPTSTLIIVNVFDPEIAIRYPEVSLGGHDLVPLYQNATNRRRGDCLRDAGDRLTTNVPGRARDPA